MGSAVKVKEAVKVQVDKWTAVEDLESWRTKAGTSPGFETQCLVMTVQASFLSCIRCSWLSRTEAASLVALEAVNSRWPVFVTFIPQLTLLSWEIIYSVRGGMWPIPWVCS